MRLEILCASVAFVLNRFPCLWVILLVHLGIIKSLLFFRYPTLIHILLLQRRLVLSTSGLGLYGKSVVLLSRIHSLRILLEDNEFFDTDLGLLREIGS